MPFACPDLSVAPFKNSKKKYNEQQQQHRRQQQQHRQEQQPEPVGCAQGELTCNSDEGVSENGSRPGADGSDKHGGVNVKRWTFRLARHNVEIRSIKCPSAAEA